VTDEHGAMVNDKWQVKTEKTQRQTSFIATSREESKFLSLFAEYSKQDATFHNLFISVRHISQK